MKEIRICATCGTTFEFRVSPSRTGNRGTYCSVACRGGNNKLSHGHTLNGHTSRTYNTWVNMVRRCTKPGHSKFGRYGAAGITVCSRWADSFQSFLDDMGERPEGKTLDRKNGNLGYTKDNCQWASIKTQQRNTKSNVMIEYLGQAKCVAAWAEETGIDGGLIQWRLRNGWPIDIALTTKPKRGNRVKSGLHT